MKVEQKAQVYDSNYNVYTKLINRLEDVKDAIKKQNYGIAMDILCKPYPEFQITASTELKESEDERIRKEIANYFKHYSGGDNISIEFPKWIAWLEKQDEHKPVIEMKSAEESLGIDSDTYNEIVEECIYGEQKPVVDTKVFIPKFHIGNIVKSKSQPMLKPRNIIFIGKDCYWCEDKGCISFALEDDYEIVEQKPTDKARPKFKVGDWLVHDERRIIIKVLKATPLDYEVVDVLGYHHTITDDAIKNNYHLWTIKDAKDGDILIVENIIFIYKRALASHIVSCCKLINDVFEPTVDARTCCEGNPYVHPATIEQRNTLFSKMEEAGYTFDFRNKELKKLTEKI